MLKKIIEYGTSEAFTKGLNKLLILLLPFLLSVDNYGVIGLIISLELLLPFVTLLGFERAILRFHNNDQFKIENLVHTILISLKYTHIFLIIICFIFYLLGFQSFFGINIYDFILIVILVYFQCYNRIMLMVYRVEDEHQKYFRSKLYLQIGRFILVLILCYIFDDYKGYLVGSLIISALINFIFRSKSKSKSNFDKKTFKYILLFSWPFIFHGLSMNFLSNADKFIIQKFLGLDDVGQYTFASSIASMIFFAFIGISVYLEPKIYKAKDSFERDKILDLFTIITLLTGLVFYILICLSTYIIPYFYTKGYDDALQYIPYLAMSYLLYPFYLTSNYKMIYEHKTKTLASVSILTCIISLGLNYLLIPIYGIQGAVLINVISYYIQINCFIFISDKLRIKISLIENIFVGLIIVSFVYFKVSFYLPIVLLSFYLMYLLLIRKKYIILKN